MSDKQYDSVLVGYAEEPRYNDEKYATSRNAEGQGGNLYVTMFMSKNGKPCCRVFDPNSAAAKEKRAAKAATQETTSDLPF